MDFKQKLMDTLKVAVEQFNRVGDPNEAVSYAAKRADFNLNQAERLTELFNSARTLYHYETSEDRSSEFPLAEKSSVLLNFVEKKPEKGAEAKTDKLFYLNYSLNEKRSGSESEAEDYSGRIGITHGEELSRALVSEFRNAELFIDNLNKTASVCDSEAASSIRKAAGCLTDGGSFTIKRRIEKFALLADSNELIKKYADAVLGCIPPFMYPKEGSSKTLYMDDSELKPVYEFLGDADSLKQKSANFKASAESFAKELASDRGKVDAVAFDIKEAGKDEVTDFFTDEYREKTGQSVAPPPYDRDASWESARYGNPLLLGAPGSPREPQPSFIETPSWPLPEPEKKEKKKRYETPSTKKDSDNGKGVGSSPILAALDAARSSSLVGRYPVEDIPKLFLGEEEKERTKVNKKLQNTRRELILSELVMNDPILSDEDPEEVASAYNTLVDIAPEGSMNKSVVRAFLRQAVHSQALDTFTVEQITKMEQNLPNVHGKTQKPGEKVEG